MTMLTVDGATGGGQILRSALTYSALSGRAVRVAGIRAGRPRPGLQAQHLLAVKAMTELCGAEVAGAELGSSEVTFGPGPIAPPAEWRLDIGTAGSVMLILQALLPCLALAPTPVDLTLTGGTNNPWAPPVEYFQHVLLPALARMGVRVHAELASRGFYPKGGGRVRVGTQPLGAIKPVAATERGGLARVWGISYSSNLPEHITERMTRACRERLADHGLASTEFLIDTATPSPGPGCGIIALAEFEHAIIAGDALGERGKPAQQVGREAADALARDVRTGAAVDCHLADQLVAWVALARGDSAYLAARRSDHLVSAIAVAEQVIGARLELSGEEPVEVRCRGVGRSAR